MTRASALAAPGRRRDDVLAGAARAARILVGDVEDALVVRVAVDGVHQPLLDADEVVDDLGQPERGSSSCTRHC